MGLSDTLIATSDPIELEAILLAELAKVDFIGQLDISEDAFYHFSKWLRHTFLNHDLQNIRIPHAIFLTSMVFCARYSNEDSRNFWKPYAGIWQVKNDHKFQNRCREHFRQSRHVLSTQFGFEFPHHRSGEVVRPIYFHALIPAHLKDDFANWLIHCVSDFIRMDEQQIKDELSDQNISSPTLRRFITDENTQPAALALIAEVLDAVRLYQEGESPDAISDYLSGIIEREIWQQILPVLQTHSLTKTRVRSPKIEWVWELDSGLMALRVLDVTSQLDHKPFEIVLSRSNQLPFEAEWRERVYPWERSDGSWYVDEHIFTDTVPNMTDYRVTILDDAENIIFTTSVPDLPSEEVVFWRITQQEAFAIPIPYPNSLPDGDWIILLKSRSNIDSELKEVTKPDLLYHQYDKALRGFIRFPISISLNNRTDQIDRRFATLTQVSLTGSQLHGLSTKHEPVFSNHDIWLHIQTTAQQISRLRLSIEIGGRTIKRLKLSQAQLIEKNGVFAVHLKPYLQGHAGLFTLDLSRSTASVLNSPLQFGVLPESVEIVSHPDPDTIYHPDNLPQAVIRGVKATDIILDEYLVATETTDGTLQIIWSELRKPVCHMMVAGVNLTWDIRRIWAWLDHEDLTQVNDVADLAKASLHIRGLRYQSATIEVNDARYEIRLDAKGRFDTVIEKDRLYEILRSHENESIRLQVGIDHVRCPLWEHTGQVTVEQGSIRYDWYKSILSAEVKLSSAVSGRFEYLVHKIKGPQKTLIRTSRWTLLQRQSVLGITIPLTLQPSLYRLSIAHNGTLLQSNSNVSFLFQVLNPQHELLHSDRKLTRSDKLTLLTLHRREFAEIEDKVLKNRWNTLRFISMARNWSDPLPAWAVTGNPLSFNIIFGGGVKQVLLYPEMALHQGRTGIGKMAIIMRHGPDDLERLYAYAYWEKDGTGSQLRLWLPDGEPLSYWDLNPEDMYPVYYSKRHLQFYAKRGYPTQAEKEQLDLQEVGFESSLPGEVYPNMQHALQYTYKPHYIVDRLHFIARIFNDRYIPTKQAAQFYRSGIDDFMIREQDYRDTVLDFLNPEYRYRQSLEQFGELIQFDTLLKDRTLIRVTHRFIQNALIWSNYVEHDYLPLDRLVMLLALALRTKAYYPQLRDQIEAVLPSEHLADLVRIVDRISPKLFRWALTWVELFAIHATS